MHSSLYRNGDRVEMKMDKEARSWGRPGPADGTRGTVVGRYKGQRYYGWNERRRDREPGLYSFDGTIQIIWDGEAEQVSQNCTDVTLVNKIDLSDRETAWSALDQDGRNALIEAERNEVRIGDLPETPFFPGDIVRSTNPGRDRSDDEEYFFRVTSIDYHFKFNDGTSVHMYQLAAYRREDGRSAFSTSDRVEHLELVERGNIYRDLMGEPLIFRDLHEETAFASMMDRAHEVRNPASGLYSWTKDEVLAGIEAGIVDGFTMPQILFSPHRVIRAEVFDDRDLGERVRIATLKGFDLIAA